MREERGERGAVAPVAALMMVVLLGAAAFVLDIGTQRVARTDMQALADVVALDLSRELNGRTANQLAPLMPALATSSRDRNKDGAGSTPTITVKLGKLGSDGRFSEYTTTAEKSTPVLALQVTATTRVAFALGGTVTDGTTTSGSTTRVAVGVAATAACYKLASWAGASAGTGDWTLVTPWLRLLAGESGAFGDGSAVKTLSYHPLAAASVNLPALATALGKGSVADLAASQVGLKALMTALKAQATPLSSANTTTMTTLVSNASSSKTVAMNKILAIDPTFGTPTDATVNLLDAVGGAISQVDTTAVPELGFGSAISGMSSGFIQSSMSDGPRQYCGYNGSTQLTSSAMTPKGQYSAGGLISSPLSVTDFGLTATSIFTASASSYTKSLTAYGYVIADALNVASSSARLSSLDCAAKKATVQVSRGAATVGVKAKVYGSVKGTVKIGGKTYTNATVSISSVNSSSGYDVVTGDAAEVPVTLAPSSTVSTTVSAGAAPVPAGSATITTGSVTYPHGTPPVTITYTSGGKQVAITATDAEKQQIYTSVYNAALTLMVDPTRSGNLLTKYVEPLVALAGVSVGGVEVGLDSAPSPTCAQPKLAG